MAPPSAKDTAASMQQHQPEAKQIVETPFAEQLPSSTDGMSRFTRDESTSTIGPRGSGTPLLETWPGQAAVQDTVPSILVEGTDIALAELEPLQHHEGSGHISVSLLVLQPLRAR